MKKSWLLKFLLHFVTVARMPDTDHSTINEYYNNILTSLFKIVRPQKNSNQIAQKIEEHFIVFGLEKAAH